MISGKIRSRWLGPTPRSRCYCDRAFQ
jgi:hypothetical protein